MTAMYFVFTAVVSLGSLSNIISKKMIFRRSTSYSRDMPGYIFPTQIYQTVRYVLYFVSVAIYFM